MSIVSMMIEQRVTELLIDLEILSIDIAAYQRDATDNPTVAGMIDSKGMASEHLERMAILQFQLVMLTAVSN